MSESPNKPIRGCVIGTFSNEEEGDMAAYFIENNTFGIITYPTHWEDSPGRITKYFTSTKSTEDGTEQ